MKVKKENLRNALEIVKPGLSNKELIEQSTSFAFIKGRVVTYNDEISISHPVEDLKISGAIKAEELYALLSKIKEEEIDIVPQEAEILIKAGRVSAGITLQKEIILPLQEIGEISAWKGLPSDFAEQLKFIIPACSTDMSKPILTCVHVKESVLQATDNYRLMECKVTKAIPGDAFLLPATSAVHVAKLSPTQIAFSKGWVHFKTKENTIISCRLFEDQYPDITPHMKVKGFDVIFPKLLKDALDRAEVFAKRQNYLESEVDIEIKENRIFVEGKSASGWFSEEINMKYSGNPINFKVTPLFLKDMLSQTNTATIGENKIKFTTESWQYVALLRVHKAK